MAAAALALALCIAFFIRPQTTVVVAPAVVVAWWIHVHGRHGARLGRVVAFAVPTAGAALPGAEDVARFAADRLASFKLPEEIFELDELPRTATGKIRKFALRERLA